MLRHHDAGPLPSLPVLASTASHLSWSRLKATSSAERAPVDSALSLDAQVVKSYSLALVGVAGGASLGGVLQVTLPQRLLSGELSKIGP